MFAGFTAFTWFHTILSLVALVAGVPVVRELLASRVSRGWTEVFLATAVLTSVTGFGFPFDKLLPSHIVGIISLVLLAAAVLGLYVFHLSGPWRWIYAAGQTLAEYFLVFVLIAQLFNKIPALARLAPTQSEPPFAIAQGILLVIFAALTIGAALKFKPASGQAA